MHRSFPEKSGQAVRPEDSSGWHTNNVNKPGKITIYDKKSNAELIGVKFSGKILEFHYGNILDNITELLYEEQSLIIYKDFNFDGVKDFALQDGFNGNYSSATYRIFLANKGQFILNKDFTELSQYNFGMFEVDYEKKILKTFIKDGCCWHEYSEYIVENNVPEVAAIITEDATKDDEYVYITEKRLVDGKWITKERKELIKDYYKEDEWRIKNGSRIQELIFYRFNSVQNGNKIFIFPQYIMVSRRLRSERSRDHYLIYQKMKNSLWYCDYFFFLFSSWTSWP